MRAFLIIMRAAALSLAYSPAVIAAPRITRSLATHPRFARQDAVKCGIDSVNGNQCPSTACCSLHGWCGTTSDYCGTGCQEGFGSCNSVKGSSVAGQISISASASVQASPSASILAASTSVPNPGLASTSILCDGSSATARKVGYYLSFAVDRPCDALSPNGLNTAGLTHINFAFALFDSVNFDFYPERPGSENLYTEFTALKTSTLQTWIAIGGGGFNDAGSSTKYNWGIMTSTYANRAQWITNLIRYMDKYGFQGVDIDWEWPVDEQRGGTYADKDNFVALVKEMKAGFGDRYGLSVALVTDITALQYIDVKGMEPYVDFFNFMSYDYHIPSDSPAYDATALPHTDITQTDKNLQPLWSAGITLTKINLGLAYYGVSYQMTSDCDKMDCPYVSPGTAGSCTGSAGLLSNLEIRHIVNAEGISPILISKSMVKQATYGTNQLILYDDTDTYRLKTDYASSKCLGGTMIWSIDQGI